MIRALTVVLLLGLCSCTTTPRFTDEKKEKIEQDRIASSIEQLPISKTKLFLFSLNPSGQGHSYSENAERVFHGFTILGKAEISSDQDKHDLLATFTRGVRENYKMVFICFNPRHGIRMIDGSTTNDFVICFECLSVRTYGFNSNKGFLTSRSPQKTFNEFLTKYRLEKAKED